MLHPPKIPAEAFFIDRSTEVPLHVQLQRQIVSGVLEARFRPGDKLPATRALADHLRVARVTVGQAYAELVSIDCLASRDRSGHYVSPRIDVAPISGRQSGAGPTFDWTRHIDGRFSRTGRTDFVKDWRSYKFPFIYGQIDPALTAHSAWRDCAMRALGRRDYGVVTSDLYGEDDPELVDYILRHILPRRGIQARADQVLLTQGAQNGLWMVAEILLTQGRTAVIEDPCYPGLREILALSQSQILPLAIDAQGLDPAQIPTETDVVFTTASHQCPANVAMPEPRRRALLQRAMAEGFAVIEDDYEFEMFFAGTPSPALKAMDRGGAVIHLGSFSKTVFPGLRLGYMVADPRFIAEARALRARSLRHPPGMLQRTLANFLALGHYDAQMTRLRRVNAERRALIQAGLVAGGLGTGFRPDADGSTYWIAAPEGVDMTKVAQKLRPDGVLIEPGTPFCQDPAQGRRHFRLGYMAVPTDRITEGVAKITTAIASAAKGAGQMR